MVVGTRLQLVQRAGIKSGARLRQMTELLDEGAKVFQVGH